MVAGAGVPAGTSATPGRFRQRSPTTATGSTPRAKRPDQRPDPGQAATREQHYTQAEVTALLEQIQRAYSSDMAWMAQVRETSLFARRSSLV